MDPTALTNQLTTAVTLFAMIAGPPLGVALVVGLVVGVLQAATQIQDQTLPMSFKLGGVFVTMLAFGGTLFPPLLDYTRQLLDQFPTMTR